MPAGTAHPPNASELLVFIIVLVDSFVLEELVVIDIQVRFFVRPYGKLEFVLFIFQVRILVEWQALRQPPTPPGVRYDNGYDAARGSAHPHEQSI
jgi:hypothetical protein